MPGTTEAEVGPDLTHREVKEGSKVFSFFNYKIENHVSRQEKHLLAFYEATDYLPRKEWQKRIVIELILRHL